MRRRSTGLLALILTGVAAAQTPPLTSPLTSPLTPPVTPPASSSSFVDLVPSDALAFVGWRGTADPGPGYAGSRWEAALKDSQIARFVNETLPAIGVAVERRNVREAALWHAAASVARQVILEPSAAFVSMTDAGPRGGLLCHAGADGPALVATFRQIAGQLQPQYKARVIADGDRVGLLLGYDADADAAGGIDRDAAFVAAGRQVTPDPTFLTYVNVAAARTALVTLLARPDAGVDPQAWEYAAKFLEASGLNGVNAFVAAAGFDGRDWRTDAFVDAPAPRKGLFDVAAAAAPDAALLARVPASSYGVTAFTFDALKALASVRTVAGEVDPRGGDLVDKAVGAATMAIGKNVQNDLLASFGPGWAAYTSPVTGGSSLNGVVLLNKLANPLKARQAMAALSIFLSNSSQNVLRDKAVTVAGRMTKVGDLSVYYVATPIASPAWAIKDGVMYLGLYPQTVVSAARYGGASITTTPAFADAARLAGGATPSSVGYTDVDSTLGDGYGLAVALGRTAFGLSDVFLAPTPEPLLPPLDALKAQATPTVSATWVDAAGLHARSRSAFPGAEALANLSLANLYLGNAPLTASVLLPSLYRAREQANRVASLSHLRQIGLGCQLYANEHADSFPPDFGTLLRSEDLTVDVFLRPGSDTERPPVPDGTNAVDVYAPWAVEHGDYVYVGGGKTTKQVKPDVILAYEKPAPGGEGINVLFADGHAEFVASPRIAEVFAAGGVPALTPAP